MTVIKDQKIMVAPDPFNISEQFLHDFCSIKTFELYKNYLFLEYFLIDSKHNSQKNSTYNNIEIQTTKNSTNINSDEENRILSFRISKEELNKLNQFLQINFQYSNQLTMKAISIPEFMKNKPEMQTYTKAYLSIFDKPTNAIKSGILFKPLKKPYQIIDIEDEMEDDENKVLGHFLYNSIIKTKMIKKFVVISNKSKNKIMNMFLYKEKDIKEKNFKNYMFLSHFSNYVHSPSYIDNCENDEELKYINKIEINSDILIKILRNFNNDSNNPDYISIWTKGLVLKTDFILKTDYDDVENNEGNNFFDNEIQDSQNTNDNNENDRNYMILKAFIIFGKKAETINFDGINIDDGNEKRKFVLNLIENNVDDKHDELNKSLDLSDNDIEEGVVFRNNNNFMDEDEDEEFFNDDNNNDNNNNNDNKREEGDDENKKKENIQKEKDNEKMEKSEISVDNDNGDKIENNNEDQDNNKKRKKVSEHKTKKNKKNKK